MLNYRYKILQSLFISIGIFSTPLLGEICKNPSTLNLIEKAKREAGEIKPHALYKMIQDEVEFILLDIREPEQKGDGEIYANEYYEITRGNLEFYVSHKIHDKNAIIVTYCRSGKRGAFAAQTLKHLQYKNAISLKGGLKAWAKAGLPIETDIGVMKLITQ